MYIMTRRSFDFGEERDLSYDGERQTMYFVYAALELIDLWQPNYRHISCAGRTFQLSRHRRLFGCFSWEAIDQVYDRFLGLYAPDVVAAKVSRAGAEH